MIDCDLIRAGLFACMAIPGTPFAVLCVLLSCTVLLGRRSRRALGDAAGRAAG